MPKEKIIWSKTGGGAKFLLQQFKLFDSSNGKSGIDPEDCTKATVKDIILNNYASARSLIQNK